MNFITKVFFSVSHLFLVIWLIYLFIVLPCGCLKEKTWKYMEKHEPQKSGSTHFKCYQQKNELKGTSNENKNFVSSLCRPPAQCMKSTLLISNFLFPLSSISNWASKLRTNFSNRFVLEKHFCWPSHILQFNTVYIRL